MSGLLEGNLAVVTGGASGIGEAIAKGYAKEGAHVVILDNNLEGAAAVVKEILDEGGEAWSLKLDVTNRNQCRQLAVQIAEKIGQTSILVNNAGINRRNAFTADADDVTQDWEDIIGINLGGVFNVTHAFVEPTTFNKGRIVNIGSIQSFLHAHTQLTRLHHIEARRAWLYEGARGRARKGWRAGQCHRPGPHRNSLERECAVQQSGTHPDVHGSHAVGPHWKARRHRRASRVPASDLAAYVTGGIVMADGGYRAI